MSTALRRCLMIRRADGESPRRDKDASCWHGAAKALHHLQHQRQVRDVLLEKALHRDVELEAWDEIAQP